MVAFVSHSAFRAYEFGGHYLYSSQLRFARDSELASIIEFMRDLGYKFYDEFTSDLRFQRRVTI
jgi:hypothetical protein